MPNEPPEKPKSGVRVLLDRETGDVSGARYRVAVFTPSAQHELTALISADGAVQFEGAPSNEPAGDRALEPALMDLVRSLTRTMAKGALSESPPVWPARINRWRDR